MTLGKQKSGWAHCNYPQYSLWSTLGYLLVLKSLHLSYLLVLHLSYCNSGSPTSNPKNRNWDGGRSWGTTRESHWVLNQKNSCWFLSDECSIGIWNSLNLFSAHSTTRLILKLFSVFSFQILGPAAKSTGILKIQRLEVLQKLNYLKHAITMLTIPCFLLCLYYSFKINHKCFNSKGYYCAQCPITGCMKNPLQKSFPLVFQN